METAIINQGYVAVLQLQGLFFIGNILLLWMMFRGVTNANLYGVNTFGKVMHSVISLCSSIPNSIRSFRYCFLRSNTYRFNWRNVDSA